VPAIGEALPTDVRLQVIFNGGVPRSTADLKAMQDRLTKLADKLAAVTVGVWLPNGMGSGVIISEDGYVMTAGHVVDRPGKEVTIMLPDGKKLKATTLGADYGMDSGLIKITEPGKWPFAPLGDSSKLKVGQWCIATGHPGGFEKDRSPPLRFGRILELSSKMVVTDCPLVGGDSGGPLFDTDGRVIGINSRIGNELYSNIHVPAAAFRETWGRLVKGDAWGGRRPNGPFIGVIADRSVSTATVGEVIEGGPADEAGLKSGDVIVSVGGTATPTFESLVEAVSKHDPGDRVKLELRRKGEKLELDLLIGRYGG
jgi:serine protease Do